MSEYTGKKLKFRTLIMCSRGRYLHEALRLKPLDLQSQGPWSLLHQKNKQATILLDFLQYLLVVSVGLGESLCVPWISAFV